MKIRYTVLGIYTTRHTSYKLKYSAKAKKIEYLSSLKRSKTMCGMRNYLFIFYVGSKDDLKCAHVFILTNLRLY